MHFEELNLESNCGYTFDLNCDNVLKLKYDIKFELKCCQSNSLTYFCKWPHAL